MERDSPKNSRALMNHRLYPSENVAMANAVGCVEIALSILPIEIFLGLWRVPGAPRKVSAPQQQPRRLTSPA
jgi:hypothetical protein